MPTGPTADKLRLVPQKLPTEVGLCATCRHMKMICSDRDAIFYLCQRAYTDDRFRKYPALPVLQCVGYDAKSGDESTGI